MIQELAWHFGSHGFDGECCEDLSLVEFMALKNACERENISIQELGNALKFTKSGATRIIDRLENKGYVTRERSPIDGRVCCVAVTAKGTEVMSKIVGRYTAYVKEVLKNLEPQKVENINDALETLVKSIRRQEPF